MENNNSQSHKVVIYNQTYHLRSEQDEDYIRQLAGHVDQRMLEIAQASMAVDSLRVAILAAIQIADEYFQAREEIRATEADIAARSLRVAEMLDQYLEGGAAQAGS